MIFSPWARLSNDLDGDGMADIWERINNIDDPAGDADGDGLANLAEHDARTNPNERDTDGDGVVDRYELLSDKTSPVDPV